jgi:hypothetical protein
MVIITDIIKDVPVNAVETYRRVNVSHLTSALVAAEWGTSRTGRFTPSEYPHLTQVGVLSECLEEKKPPAMPRIEIRIVHTHINTSTSYYIVHHTVSWPREINILTQLPTTVFKLCLTLSYSLRLTLRITR